MILTIIAAILFFSIIIFVHELGHFIAAKAFSVNVIEFSIGMGPALFKKQGKNTLYSVRAIPMGGFCKMEGEDENTKTDGCFSSKSPLAKIIILASGAAMNLLLGFIIIVILTTSSGIKYGYMTSTYVASVEESADAASVLAPGDKIVKVNDTVVHIGRDISFALSEFSGESCNIEFIRNGERKKAAVKPMEYTYDDGTKGYMIGFKIAPAKINLGNILYESFFQTIWMIRLVFISLGMLLGGKVAVTEISGPVGVVSAMNTVAQSGMYDFFFFAAFLAINIGVMNLLPLPALDGGRIAFSLFELVFRKPVPPEKEGIVHAIGFVLLVGLMIFATSNDIIKLFTGGFG